MENLIYSSNVAHNNNIIIPGTDPGVFQGGGGGGGGAGTLGLRNQWCMPTTKCCNLGIGTKLKTVTPEKLQ